jgi:FkbM family methyltransferase
VDRPMKTTQEAKVKFIKEGSEIENELYSLFFCDQEIVIADIGACDGLSSIIYGNMFPKATIHAFEPLRDNYDEMLDNFGHYGLSNRAVAYNTALGSRAGKATFWRSYGQAPGVEGWETGNKSSSLLKPRRHVLEHPWCNFRQESVSVVTLDSLNIPRIDFAHIDVQGAELEVLRGGVRTFSTTKALWLEVANCDLYQGQPLKHNIENYLGSDFKVMKDTCGNRKYGDVLFVRK